MPRHKNDLLNLFCTYNGRLRSDTQLMIQSDLSANKARIKQGYAQIVCKRDSSNWIFHINTPLKIASNVEHWDLENGWKCIVCEWHCVSKKKFRKIFFSMCVTLLRYAYSSFDELHWYCYRWVKFLELSLMTYTFIILRCEKKIRTFKGTRPTIRISFSF